MWVGLCSRIVDKLFTSRQTLIHRVPKHPPIKIHGVVATEHNTLNPQHTHNRNLGCHHSQSAFLDEAKKKYLALSGNRTVVCLAYIPWLGQCTN